MYHILIPGLYSVRTHAYNATAHVVADIYICTSFSYIYHHVMRGECTPTQLLAIFLHLKLELNPDLKETFGPCQKFRLPTRLRLGQLPSLWDLSGFLANLSLILQPFPPYPREHPLPPQLVLLLHEIIIQGTGIASALESVRSKKHLGLFTMINNKTLTIQ